VKLNVLFIWNEMPPYAAKQINYLIKNTNYNIKIISEISNLNEKKIIKNLLKKNITIIKKIESIDDVFKKVSKLNYKLIFSSGWRYKNISKLINYFKKYDPSIRHVMMMDNCRKNNFSQWVGKLYYKLLIDHKYDAFWVPGKSSVKLLNYYQTKKKIFTGLYSYDDKVFNTKLKIENKDPNFVFIGQLIDRKNFFLLIKSFRVFQKIYKNPKLYIVGTNPKKIDLNKYKFKNIFFKINLNPNKVGEILKKNRFFILLSKIDHWPLALVESLACNCISILSCNIGSITDLKIDKNILINKKLTIKSIVKSLFQVTKYNRKVLNKINFENNLVSKRYTHKNFLLIFNKIVKNLVNEKYINPSN